MPLLSYRSLEQTHEKRRILFWALLPNLMLLVPFVAMQFTDDVKWGVGDFVIAAVVLAAAGTLYAIITLQRRTGIFRITAGLAVAILFMLLWAELAVGIFD